jgi:hypothetical protein
MPALAVAAAATLAATFEDAFAGDGLVFYADGGASFPAAPPEFPDFWNIGWSAGLGLGVALAPAWEVVTSAHLQRYGADEGNQVEGLLLEGPGGLLDIASIDGRDVETIALLAEIRFHGGVPDAVWRPFLAFGAGFIQVSTTDAMVTAHEPGFEPVPIPGDSDAAFAAAIGGGVARRISPRVSLVFDATYLIGFTEQSSTESIPFRLGLAIE